MMQVLAAATKASSGVNTPAWPCASGGAEKVHLRPVAHHEVAQCSPFQATSVV